MKKIVSILLLLCTVVTLCISFTSCDTETVTPYTRLRDHLNSELKPGQSMQMKNPTAKVVVDIWPNVSEGEDESIRVRTTIPMEAGYKGYIEFQLYNGSTEYKIDFETLAKETSLKGVFVKKMLEKQEQAEDKETVKRALKIGLKAFSNEVKYNED